MGKHVIGMDTAQRVAAVWDDSTSLQDAMRRAGVKTQDMRKMNRYRRCTEDMLGITLSAHNAKFSQQNNWPRKSEHIEIDGSLVVFSDAHFWPHATGAAYFGLLEVLAEIKPQVVLDNGDSFDGATISRHAPISFDRLPSLAEEYECCMEHMDAIIDAAGDAEFYRNVGNHDLRFEGKMASKVPEMIGMPATTIGELFPKWKHNYSVVFNDELIAMHKWHCGIHAAWNNVLKAGKSIMTSHTHRLKILPHTDFSGRKYSIETGCLADPEGDQFSYCLDTAKDWQPGFVVIEFDDNGMHPECAELIGNRIRFRGKYYG